jgi:diguanylate cyclase (GGDEF)-like protein
MIKAILGASHGATFELYCVDDAESAEIRGEHLQQLVRLTPVLMAANAVSCLLLGLSVGPSGGWLLELWLGVMGLVIVSGLVGWWQRRGAAIRPVSRRGFGRATRHAGLLGVCWGLAPALWFPGADGAHQVLMSTLVTGMLGAGAFVLAMLPRASLVYVGAVTAGALLALARSGEPLYGAVALLLISYASVVSVGVMALARQSTALLRSRFEQARQQQVVSLLLRDFEENASDALWETDEQGRLVHSSARLAVLLGVEQADLPTLRLPHWFAERAHDSRALLAAWALGRPFRDLKLQVGTGPAARWWALSAKPKIEGSGPPLGWRGVIADVTEPQRFENQLRLLSEQDALTGLANRRALLQGAEAAVALGREGWLLSVDLDHFKAINDTSGHSVGDEVLRVVAQRLRSVTTEGDLLARLGGDEFALLRLGNASPVAVHALAERMIAVLTEPIALGLKRLHVGASVGVARLEAEVHSFEELMVNADLALYDAKRGGRGRHVIYAAQLGDLSRREHAVEQALREGLRLGEFELHFQPKVDADTLAPLGVEALMRWQQPELGSISPGEFIPAAERCGLIHELGEFALHQACRAAGLLPGLTVAVNVSPLQLMDSHFVDTVHRVLDETGITPSRLQLEVTESLLLEDAPAALKRLHALRELGLQVALDDFGTGYSSLAYLRAFPFDALKIDRSFVRSMTQHEDARAIVDMISQLAARLGMRTVAEGVETQEELAIVRACGCHEVQGYCISRPLSLPKLLAWRAGVPVGASGDAVDSRVRRTWQRTG